MSKKIYLLLLSSIIGFSNASLAQSPKTSLRKAYQVNLAVAAAATVLAAQKEAEAKEKNDPDAEKEANFLGMLATSTFQAGLANYLQYQKFNSKDDISTGSVASSRDPNISLNLANLPGSSLRGSTSARKETKEDTGVADSPGTMSGVDPSQILSSDMSREDLARFLQKGDMPKMSEVDFDVDKGQGGTATGGLSTNLNFMAYGGGEGGSRNDLNLQSMLGGLFGDEKKVNSEYVGNIPLRYLATEEIDIWKRISITTQKHLLKN